MITQHNGFHEATLDAELETIARRVLGIRTLVPAKSDRLDFHEVGVESLRDALRMAYQAGWDAGKA